MSDVDRIRKAVELWDHDINLGYRPDDETEIPLVDAARRFLQIAEQSERSVWCEEHNAPQWRGDECYTVRAIESKHGGRLEFGSCRIVERWTFLIEEDEEDE